MAQLVSVEIGIGVDPTVYDGLVKLTRVGSALVYNAALADADFRIAGDTDANLLFVDAANDQVIVGKASGAMGTKFTVSDGTDEIGLDVDGTDAFVKWSDGLLQLITDEGTNTNTIVEVRGKGTGRGILRVRDEDSLEYLEFTVIGGVGQIATAGSSPGDLRLQQAAHANVNMFLGAAGAERPMLLIYGRDQGTTLRNLRIGISGTANDRVEFTNLATYLFDGIVATTGDLIVDGGDIGVTADPDLIQLANNSITFNGTIDASGVSVTLGATQMQTTATFELGHVNVASMDASVAGNTGALLYNDNDNKSYTCVVTGGAGSATWTAHF